LLHGFPFGDDDAEVFLVDGAIAIAKSTGPTPSPSAPTLSPSGMMHLNGTKLTHLFILPSYPDIASLMNTINSLTYLSAESRRQHAVLSYALYVFGVARVA
jgi:hypothetical protein